MVVLVEVKTVHKSKEIILEGLHYQKTDDPAFREFYKELRVGGLFEVSVDYYETGAFLGGEYYVLLPALLPGKSMMFLGWIDSPGEEVVLRSVSGFEKVWKLTGPKWLLDGKVWIQRVPTGILQPVVG